MNIVIAVSVCFFILLLLLIRVSDLNTTVKTFEARLVKLATTDYVDELFIDNK